jgi:Tol biopolymer transport system component
MISAGTRFGPYEVLSPLGAGGMGEVYRARDSRLRRDVAIKILPASFAEDPDRLARFQREAQVLAALNHPEIAAIYGLEEKDGIQALVLELVPGETLAERLARGPIPLDEALEVARQMADALAAAHEKGIVHRDLKPANVKCTREGKVKLLDFGLARALATELASGDLSTSPTVTAPATKEGVVLGTAAYMSPEQARGKGVDRRADIWAWGCVLYEMLAGGRTFAGESISDTLAAVLTREPDWSALPAETPASVVRVLKRCLDRDVRTRFHDVADARIELDESPEPSTVTAPAVPPKMGRRAAPWLAAVLLGAAAAAGWWRTLRKPASPPASLARLAVPLAEADRIPFDDMPVFDLSRDGRQLVYVSDRGEGRRLYLRGMDRTEAKTIVGTDGAFTPFFSPDGRSIGFFAGGKLKKVSTDGGVPVALGDAASPRGGVWLADDTIVFAPELTSGLKRIAARGGPAEVLTNPDAAKGERTHRWPALLPGGALLFAIGTLEHPDNFDDARVACLDPGTRRIRVLLENASMARYVADSRLVLVRAGSLAAVAFDSDRREVRGEPVTLSERAAGDRSSGISYWSVTPDGTLVYLAASVGVGERSLVLTDRKGEARPLPLPVHPYHFPRFSPDGKRLAVSIGSGRNLDDDIWICDIAAGTLTRLTFGNTGVHPVWSPDGKRVAFSTSRNRQSVWSRNVDGSGKDEPLEPGGNQHIPSSWAPDGRSLAVIRGFPAADILLLPLGGKPEARLFQAEAYGPVFSPDGRWIAYASAAVAGSTDQIVAQSASGSGGKFQLTSEGGGYPVWVGREIFFVRRNRVYAMMVETQPAFRAAAARLLFEAPFDLSTGPLRNYDVSPDGKSFIFVRGVSEAPWRQFDVALNWTMERK